MPTKRKKKPKRKPSKLPSTCAFLEKLLKRNAIKYRKDKDGYYDFVLSTEEIDHQLVIITPNHEMIVFYIPRIARLKPKDLLDLGVLRRLLKFNDDNFVFKVGLSDLGDVNVSIELPADNGYFPRALLQEALASIIQFLEYNPIPDVIKGDNGERQKAMESEE